MYSTISDLIFHVVYQDVIGNETSPYNQLKRKLYDIDKDYFEKIPADTEKLDRNLTPALRDLVVDNFKKLADFYLGPSYQNYLLESVHRMMDAHFPNADSQSIVQACETAEKNLLEAAKYRFDHPEYQYEEPCPQVSEERMIQAYQRAKKRTIMERINQVNKADVINFHHVLLQKTVWDCKELIENKVVSLIKTVLSNLNH